METDTQHAKESLAAFSSSLDALEGALRPVLAAVDELRNGGHEDDVPAMTQARLHITMSYAVNSLFCMYLRAQGQDPAEHPVVASITRVQDAFLRMRKVEAGAGKDPVTEKKIRKRVVNNAEKSSAKLSNVLVPEESELAHALKGGKKRKRDEGASEQPAKVAHNIKFSDDESAEKGNSSASKAKGSSKKDKKEKRERREKKARKSKKSSSKPERD